MRDLASALSDWLPQQRWFQGKARTVCGVQVADAVRLGLGQVLLVGRNAWELLDFEGEPARPLAERRARSSPLRDVAGILRSFDYVAGAQPHRRALEWRARARERFLDAYLAGADAAGLLLPKDPEPVLAAFEFDKAIYEWATSCGSAPTGSASRSGASFGCYTRLDRVGQQR